MAPGVRVFAKTQIGIETVKGTAVDATKIYGGPVAFPVDDSPLVFTPQDVGISGGTDRSHRPFKLASIAFPKHVPSYQQLPYILQAAIRNIKTGVADGSGSDFIYAYPLPTTAAYDINTLTVEGMDDYQEYESEDVFFTEINISGKANEGWQVEAKANGRQVTPGTRTAGLTPSTVEDILFQNTKLYLDAIGGTMGSTVKANTFLGFEAKLMTGWKPQPTGDGNLYFSFPKYVGYKFTGKLIFEHDAIGKAQFDAFQASTPQLMRIRALGSALQTPGTTYSYLTASIDAPIKYTKASEIKDEGGNDVIEMEWESKYNTTAAIAGSITVVNETSAL